jgi:hypothetical protein
MASSTRAMRSRTPAARTGTRATGPGRTPGAPSGFVGRLDTAQRVDAYSALVDWLLLTKLVLQRHRPMVAPCPEPPAWPGEETLRHLETQVRLFGSVEVDTELLALTPLRQKLSIIDAELEGFDQRKTEVSDIAGRFLKTWSDRSRYEAWHAYHEMREENIAAIDALVDLMRDETSPHQPGKQRGRWFGLQKESKS